MAPTPPPPLLSVLSSQSIGESSPRVAKVLWSVDIDQDEMQSILPSTKLRVPASALLSSTTMTTIMKTSPTIHDTITGSSYPSSSAATTSVASNTTVSPSDLFVTTTCQQSRLEDLSEVGNRKEKVKETKDDYPSSSNKLSTQETAPIAEEEDDGDIITVLTDNEDDIPPLKADNAADQLSNQSNFGIISLPKTLGQVAPSEPSFDETSPSHTIGTKSSTKLYSDEDYPVHLSLFKNNHVDHPTSMIPQYQNATANIKTPPLPCICEVSNEDDEEGGDEDDEDDDTNLGAVHSSTPTRIVVNESSLSPVSFLSVSSSYKFFPPDYMSMMDHIRDIDDDSNGYHADGTTVHTTMADDGTKMASITSTNTYGSNQMHPFVVAARIIMLEYHAIQTLRSNSLLYTSTKPIYGMMSLSCFLDEMNLDLHYIMNHIVVNLHDYTKTAANTQLRHPPIQRTNDVPQPTSKHGLVEAMTLSSSSSTSTLEHNDQNNHHRQHHDNSEVRNANSHPSDQENDPVIKWEKYMDEYTANHSIVHWPIFSYAYLIICTVVLIISFYYNGWHMEPYRYNSSIGPSSDTLLKIGAVSTTLLLQNGISEWYRIGTTIAIHGGIIHWFLMMLSILFVGVILERKHGTILIGSTFLIACVVANLCALIYSPFELIVGPSGGICAWFGLLFAKICTHYYALCSLHNRMMITMDSSENGILTSISKIKTKMKSFPFFISKVIVSLELIIILLIGLLPWIDQFTHCCGFLCGLTIGLHVFQPHGSTLKFIQLSLVASKQKTKHSSNMSFRFITGWIQYLCAPIRRRIIPSLLLCALIALTTSNVFFLYYSTDVSDLPCRNCHYINCLPWPETIYQNCDPCNFITIEYVTINDGKGNTIETIDGAHEANDTDTTVLYNDTLDNLDYDYDKLIVGNNKTMHYDVELLCPYGESATFKIVKQLPSSRIEWIKYCHSYCDE